MFLVFSQFLHPCNSDFRIHIFNKILGEKLGYNEDYKNEDVDIWMLDKDVDKWGIKLKMEISQIEWCFQFEKLKDLDNVKYPHVVNLQAYKDDP